MISVHQIAWGLLTFIISMPGGAALAGPLKNPNQTRRIQTLQRRIHHLQMQNRRLRRREIRRRNSSLFRRQQRVRHLRAQLRLLRSDNYKLYEALQFFREKYKELQVLAKRNTQLRIVLEKLRGMLPPAQTPQETPTPISQKSSKSSKLSKAQQLNVLIKKRNRIKFFLQKSRRELHTLESEISRLVNLMSPPKKTQPSPTEPPPTKSWKEAFSTGRSRRALELLGKDKRSQLIKKFERHYRHGRRSHHERNTNDALEHLQIAIKLHRRLGVSRSVFLRPLHLMLANMFVHKGILEEHQGRFTSAISLFRKALKHVPDHTLGLHRIQKLRHRSTSRKMTKRP